MRSSERTVLRNRPLATAPKTDLWYCSHSDIVCPVRNCTYPAGTCIKLPVRFFKQYKNTSILPLGSLKSYGAALALLAVTRAPSGILSPSSRSYRYRAELHHFTMIPPKPYKIASNCISKACTLDSQAPSLPAELLQYRWVLLLAVICVRSA